jgi:predicted component of type VI protein secretion system
MSVGRRAPRKGPQPDLDLTPYDPLLTVSRRHALIERVAQGYTLTVESDPPPTNPVLLNGEPLAPGEGRPLAEGALLQIGLVELRFELDSE